MPGLLRLTHGIDVRAWLSWAGWGRIYAVSKFRGVLGATIEAIA